MEPSDIYNGSDRNNTWKAKVIVEPSDIYNGRNLLIKPQPKIDTTPIDPRKYKSKTEKCRTSITLHLTKQRNAEQMTI